MRNKLESINSENVLSTIIFKPLSEYGRGRCHYFSNSVQETAKCTAGINIFYTGNS